METNKKAMTYLKSERMDLCYKTLMKAEKKLNDFTEDQNFIGNKNVISIIFKVTVIQI